MLYRLPFAVNCVVALLFSLQTIAAAIVMSPGISYWRYPLPGAPGVPGPVATADITSDFELRSVTATFETQTVALAFSPGFQDWRASEAFDISRSPSGPATIRFSATDAFGNTAETNFTFVIDRPPTVEIESPPPGALARPLLFLSASARDDLEIPRLFIWSAPANFSNYEWFLNNRQTNHAEGIIDLSSWEEFPVDIRVQAHDSTGPSTLETRRVLSLSNPRYQPVLSIDGFIHDISSDSILYSSSAGQLIAVNRAAGTSTILKTNYASVNRLTPTGVIAVHTGSGGPGDQLFDFNRGEEIYLGSGNLLAVKGGFAVFNADNKTVLRDFLARTNYILPLRATQADVGENGVVAFVTGQNEQPSALFRFADGQLTQLSRTNEFPFAPQTDGTNVLWYSIDPNEPSPTRSVFLRTPQGLITLATNLNPELSDIFPSAMNGGWVAFPRLGTQGQQQVWLRSPAGEILQATFFSRPSRFRALLPNGAFLASIQQDIFTFDLYYIAPSLAPKLLGTDLASRLRYFGIPADYIVTGTNITAHAFGTVFDFDFTGDPVGLTSPQYDRASGTLAYYITATTPGLFSLQRSTNFVDWTVVTRNTVTNSLPTKFQTATPPGFFRLRRQ